MTFPLQSTKLKEAGTEFTPLLPHHWESGSSISCFWNLLKLAQQADISHLVAYFTDIHLNSSISQGKNSSKWTGKTWVSGNGMKSLHLCRQSLFTPARSDRGRSQVLRNQRQLMPAQHNLFAQVINRSCAFKIPYSNSVFSFTFRQNQYTRLKITK